MKGIPPQERIYGSPDAGLRPQFISPINCRNVLLEGFTIAEPGPFWTIQFIYCENVIARGLTIHTQGGTEHRRHQPRFDAQRPGRALLAGCRRRRRLPEVRHQRGWPAGGTADRERGGAQCHGALNCHGGIVIGSETSGGVRNVLAYDCVYDGSDVGIRLKSNASRGGVVENIHYRNITMRNIKTEAIQLESRHTRRNPTFRSGSRKF